MRAIVTLLAKGSIDHAIATALVRRAVGGTAIIVGMVAIVALFPEVDINDAVAAARDFAIALASVAIDEIAVVAGFAWV